MSRDYKGRFAVEMTRTRKLCLIGFAFLGILVAYGMIGEAYVDGYLKKELTAVAAPRVEAAEIDRLDQKIQALKDEVLDELANCESPGDTENTLPVIEDNNASGTLPRGEVVSMGMYRYKVGTVIGYELMRTGEELTPIEAVEFAVNHAKARELTSYVIFDTPEGDKGIMNWRTCAVKHGLQSKVDVIKSLSE
jgi:hypothetical protein